MSFISAHTKNLDTKPVSVEEKKSASATVTVDSNVSTEVESTMLNQGVDVQRYIHSESPIVSEKDDPKIEMEDITEEKGTEDKEEITDNKEDIIGEKEEIADNMEEITYHTSTS